ncbi:AP2 domain transcription factor AP2III-1 [Cardiosporidium cionae]|uniref:AP2 domain transcription factor AP2III-1 n=1 Tax=Cardiosporidium cionae TaxID=476202 RepID=A0ABQ7JDC8_9APIC|nr:AP2 domain transcription factor AP2III-1 [Cardiosporidium cionae]|eukprot:KAF8821986.1 AP2 domain transcription factor AP2III-1 [Cardiosporidium cionae]
MREENKCFDVQLKKQLQQEVKPMYSQEIQNSSIDEFLAQYTGEALPFGSEKMLAFGKKQEITSTELLMHHRESSEEESDSNKMRPKPRQINLGYPDNMWPPHFHPHNQEWRVRYRFKGAMRIKTVSCKQFGLEGARRLALAFVDRWIKSDRPLSAKTKRSKLCVLDISHLIEQNGGHITIPLEAEAQKGLGAGLPPSN